MEVFVANAKWKLEIAELRLVLAVGDKSVKKSKCQRQVIKSLDRHVFGAPQRSLIKNFPSDKTQ